MRTRIRAAICLGMMLVFLPAFQIRSATADEDFSTPIGPGLAGAVDLVYDAEHDHLFITQGTASDIVLVVDRQGRTIRELANLAGAETMEIDPILGKVYVARPTGHGVAVVDTDTLGVRHLPTPGNCPTSLAPAGATLWFTSNCRDGDYSDKWIKRIDLRAGEVVEIAANRAFSQPVVVVAPARPETLIVYEGGSNPAYLVIFDITEGPDGPTATVRQGRRGDPVTGLEVSPDGTVAVISGSTFDGATLVSLPDLDPIEEYSFFPERLGYGLLRPIAFSDTGALLMGRQWFRPGKFAPTNYLNFNNGDLRPDAAVWVGDFVYALTVARYEIPAQLHVVQPRIPSIVTSTPAGRVITIGQSIDLNLTLDTVSQAREVEVRAVARDGTSSVVARPMVDHHGTSVRLSPRRNTVYEVRYAGDDRASPAFDSSRVAVRSKVESTITSPVVRRNGIIYARSGRTIWFTVRGTSFRRQGCLLAGLSFASRYQGSWYPTDQARCVPLAEDGPLTFGVRARKGTRPHIHQVTFSSLASTGNAPARASATKILFCARTVPCKPPPMTFIGQPPYPVYGAKVRLIGPK